jgi:benzoyl-CoA reductase/2-hydroxyglutaryl-CoA dehydratase subunit BcrC/BadD/HgdB
MKRKRRMESCKEMELIGLTTTVPLEVILAAGYRPVDLINLFVTSDDSQELIDIAERDGFPKSLCACIKGMYGVCVKYGIKRVIGVIEGDCSNTKALLEVLADMGVDVIEFGFPHSRELSEMRKSIDGLIDALGTTLEDVEKVRRQMAGLRRLAIELDEETYVEDRASGFENHLYSVMFSDLDGKGMDGFKAVLEDALSEIRKRERGNTELRLAYIGVPPVTSDLYDFVEKLGAKIVYNEVQREFAFPRFMEDTSIYDQYLNYTYPYDIYTRLDRIKEEIGKRSIDAVIHYTQSFCYRAIEDIIVKKELGLPVLTIEGDKSRTTDSRTKLRFEAFIDMAIDRKRMKG